MPSSRFERDHQALLDILDNAVLAQTFIAGMDYAAFTADRRTFYAVTRCLEIVSEASKRLNEAVRKRHPHLPWRAIIGAGNVYRHEYDGVTENLVWRTASESLTELIVFARSELDQASKGGQ